MKTLYGCEYCSFSADLKGMVQFHENSCVKNPSVKTCFTCEHHYKVLECGDETGYECIVNVSPHRRIDCEDGVIKCGRHEDNRNV